MKVDIVVLRGLGAKVNAELNAELDRIEAAGEAELTPLAQELLAELASVAALVQATGPHEPADGLADPPEELPTTEGAQMTAAEPSKTLDPELIGNGVYMAASHIERGARSFDDFSKAMVADLGHWVQPYLLALYECVRHHPGFSCDGMTPSVEAARQFSESETGTHPAGHQLQQGELFEENQGSCGMKASGPPVQGRLIDKSPERTLLDQLLEDSKLYRNSRDYKELLDFVVRMPNFAPFNAMLLQLQKPGLGLAASARDWREKFGRSPKPGARPLLILWPFGPVATVYDSVDTEGEPLPKDAASFLADGKVDEAKLANAIALLAKKWITCHLVDAGDQSAGSIRRVRGPSKKDGPSAYEIYLNRNHSLAVRFVTLAHEVAHLCLGHLGTDAFLGTRRRWDLDGNKQELEAESIAFLVSRRNGVESRSHPYLSQMVQSDTTVDDLDLFQVMRAANQVESLMGLTAHSRYDKPQAR